jgi:hypothetical protein
LILVPQLLFSGVVVDFDKMHNHIASEKNVPVIGDMMTSRWAYESLMVTQFKKNRYEKHFYESEVEIRNATYFKSFGIPALRNISGDCDRLVIQKKDTLKLAQDLGILSYEVNRISDELEIPLTGFADSLNVKGYKKSVSVSLNQYLDRTERMFVSRYNVAVSKRDGEYQNLVNSLGGKDKFFAFKDRYYNQQVADIVSNEKEVMEFDIQNKEMVRIKDAIFRMPESAYGRAHFYAPVKRISGLKIDTFWFNLFFIWIFSGLLFVLLYYDVLRKIILYFDTSRLNRINRRRFLRLWVSEQSDMWKPAKE